MTTTNILAENDAWIGLDDPTHNNGSGDNLEVFTRNISVSPTVYGVSNSSETSAGIVVAGIALYRFDVTTIAAASAVSSAILHIYGGGSNLQAPAVTVFPITDNSWTEGGVTWNNQPTHDSKIGSLDVFRKSMGTLSNAVNSDNGNAWQTLDITAYVASKINGSAKDELMLYPHTGYDFRTQFKSRSDSNAPYITVVYT